MSSVDASPVDAAQSDGRTLRRDRNRIAVVDALLALYVEGNLAPSSDEIAARAGLSPRSLFRYFDDLDDLTRVAVARHLERVEPLARIDVGPSASFDDRVAALVDARVRTFEFVAPVARVARWRALMQPVVAEQVEMGRRLLRRQALELFAPELAACSPERRERVAALVDVLLSLEVTMLLRDSNGFDAAGVRAVLGEGLRTLLEER